MRWKAKPRPKHGATRVRWRFLSFPERYGDEWHWLETKWYVQKYDVGRGWETHNSMYFSTKQGAEDYAKELQKRYERYAAPPW